MAVDGVTILEDGVASIVVDERTWPLIVSTWFGAASEALVTRYFAHADGQIERARRAGQKIVLVTDTYATSPPSAKVRQHIAELSRAQTSRARPQVLASFAVVESALIRGAVTALSWIEPSMADTKYVASFDLAMEGALTAMRAARVAIPAALPVRAPNPNRASRTG